MPRNLITFLLFLVGVASAHATVTITDRGTTTGNASSSTFVISPNADMAAGSSAVLVLGLDNANSSTGNTPSTITDSVGNLWTRCRNPANSTANAGTEMGMYWAYLGTALTTGDNITVTFTNATVTAKTAGLWEMAPTAGNWVMLGAGAQALAATTNAPSLTTTNLVSNGHIVFGAAVMEHGTDGWTGDADTTNGTWSTQQHVGVGTTTTGISLTSQYKIVTATATQSYDPTHSQTSDATIGVNTFFEIDLAVYAVTANATAGASDTFTPRRTIPAGSFGVLCVAADNAGSNGSAANLPTGTGISDGSNTWTQRQTQIFDNGVATAGVETAIYTAPIITSITRGTACTLTYLGVNVTNKAFMLYVFTPAAGHTIDYVTGNVGSGVSSATPTITTASITSGDIVIGMGGAESTNTWVGDADTTNGSWSFENNVGFGSGANGMSITTQYKTTSATATQTYNPTQSAANDTLLSWISIRDSAATSAFLSFFP